MLVVFQAPPKINCWKLDLADTDFAENPGLKDTLQNVWATIFDFQYISPLEIAENLGLADKRVLTDFSAKSSFHCNLKGVFWGWGWPCVRT